MPTIGSFDVKAFLDSLYTVDPVTGNTVLNRSLTSALIESGDGYDHNTPSDIIGQSNTEAKVLIGTAADEWFDGGTGDNLYISTNLTRSDITGGSTTGTGTTVGMNRYYVGPGKPATSDGDEGDIARSASNDVVWIHDLSDIATGETPNEIIWMLGVYDNQIGLSPTDPNYDADHVAATKMISSHGRVDGTYDYRIDYTNGYTTYIKNFYGTDGVPNALLQYDNCGELEPEPFDTTITITITPTVTITVTVTVTITTTTTTTLTTTITTTSTVTETACIPICSGGSSIAININNESSSMSNAQVFNSNNSRFNGWSGWGTNGWPFGNFFGGSTSSGSSAGSTTTNNNNNPTVTTTTTTTVTITSTSTTTSTTTATTGTGVIVGGGSAVEVNINNESASMSNAQVFNANNSRFRGWGAWGNNWPYNNSGSNSNGFFGNFFGGW